MGGPSLKKFLITLFILLLLAASIFFFGWVQFRIEPGERAILFSKSSGLEDKVHYPGDFLWRWQALIPSNLKVYRFPALAQTLRADFSSQLPSSAAYTEGLDLPANAFRLEFHLELLYRLSDEALLRTLSDFLLLDQDQEAGFQELHEEIQLKLDSLLQEYGQSFMRASLNSPMDQAILPLPNFDEFLGLAGKRFPDIEIKGGSLSDIRVPDLALYHLLRNRHLTILDARTAAEADAAARLASTAASDGMKIRILNQYGEVLNQNPSLLDYFRLQAETGLDPLGLAPMLGSWESTE